MKKVALVTGCTGQDGSYLMEHLKAKDYDVYGLLRRSSSPEYHSKRIDNIFSPESRANIFYSDMIDGLFEFIINLKPDYIYNLAAQSHVWISFKQPLFTWETNALAVLRLLEEVKLAQQILGKEIRVYQASSSEMFGDSPPPQNEDTKMNPQSPYGIAKLSAYHAMRCYRKGYGLFASNGILFNHSSPRRGINFATRKITRTAARISLGLQDKIELGNLDAEREEGHSFDYTAGMIKILEHDKADDFVLAMGERHTIREWAEKSFKHFGLDLYKYLVYNKELLRSNEVPALLGDSTKARTVLGWKPTYTYDSLMKEMLEEDYRLTEKELKINA